MDARVSHHQLGLRCFARIAHGYHKVRNKLKIFNTLKIDLV